MDDWFAVKEKSNFLGIYIYWHCQKRYDELSNGRTVFFLAFIITACDNDKKDELLSIIIDIWLSNKKLLMPDYYNY